MSEEKTDAMANTEDNNQETRNMTDTGMIDLVVEGEEDDGSLGSRSISDLLGVSGPNGADGSSDSQPKARQGTTGNQSNTETGNNGTVTNN